MIHPVILCGGSGTRLWPVSRASYPKQFAPLLGRESLFQGTCRRLTGDGFAAPLVLTGADFRFLVTDQLARLGIDDAEVLIEPAGRNTAPAILTAALRLQDTPDAVLLIAPSDHLIGDDTGFRAAAAAGAAAAREGRLVTFGIIPDRPETGYGYLALGPGAGPVRPVARFVEKPDAARAAAMLAAGDHLWNAGIFMARAGDLIAAFEAHAPELLPPCRAALAEGAQDLNFFRLGAEAYGAARDISFDYAVMERAADVACVPFDGGWTDLGAWDALWRVLPQDTDGVALQGPAVALDCRDTLLRSEEEDLQLVGLGLDGVIAVAMRDAVLVADKSQAQRVREVVDLLRARQVPEADSFPRVHRPWGWYERLCHADRFQVKRIMVAPGGVLSLQSHMHRAEHWVVVSGTARITLEDDVRLLTENESVYIPLGATHRLENPGKVPMFLIEVQTGTYLGEDDITRLEDVYARG